MVLIQFDSNSIISISAKVFAKPAKTLAEIIFSPKPELKQILKEKCVILIPILLPYKLKRVKLLIIRRL